MKLTLLSMYGITSMTLPEKIIGRYWLRSRNNEGKLINIVSVEALLSTESRAAVQWILKSNRSFQIVDNRGETIQNVPLENLGLFSIQSTDGNYCFTLFTEPLTEDRNHYTGYMLREESLNITIGRDDTNDIFYENVFASREHAEISFSPYGIFVRDLGSTNNTYVNDIAVTERQLFTGDVIFIMGLRIIITRNGLFLNNPDGKVHIMTPGLVEFHAPEYFPPPADIDDFEEYPTQYYYRSPRFKHDVDEFKLKVDAPPAAPNSDEVPMAMLIGPSITMGMASLASGLFTVTNAIERGNIESALPSLVMCVSMLLGTLMCQC